MQLTREGDYGVRSVLYLSRQPYKKISFVSEIADMYGIPRSFLAKILQKLVKSGIVKSYRGVKGGFSLARPAKEISVLDVVESIEGKMAMNLCLADRKKCEFLRQCPVHHVWHNAQQKFIEELKKHNFDDLSRQKK
ncbi:MAG: Rrf2 family transcriptional regulator [Nitrospirota bacterium]|nr:Rrf2 family transcriptional regulator [Nitrospirota bacterium]